MGVGLRQFKKSELIFDEKETKNILVFFFPARVATIMNLSITDAVRGFAQGLLVEAIDASYKLGLVQALAESTTNPRIGIKKAMKKFAQKAAKHWFKHTTKGPLDIEIYEAVRRTITTRFRSRFDILIFESAHKDLSTHAAVKYA